MSLLGVKYEVIIGGQLMLAYGTSASAPVFAGMSEFLYSIIHDYYTQLITSVIIMTSVIYSIIDQFSPACQESPSCRFHQPYLIQHLLFLLL